MKLRVIWSAGALAFTAFAINPAFAQGRSLLMLT